MTDLSLLFGGDLSVNATGDLQLSDGHTLTQERILRRLLTNPGDYIWQLAYGAGLGQFVGQPGAPAAISGVARGQILQESRVASTPAPAISVAMNNDSTLTLSINYADAQSRQAGALSFNL